jgi:hypothetical protein
VALAVVFASRAHYFDRASMKGRRIALLMTVMLLMGLGAWIAARSFFEQERASGTGSLSGRVEIWQSTVTSFKEGSTLERLLGTSEGLGTTIDIPSDGGAGIRTLSIDNAFIALANRSGVIGLLIGIAGLCISVRWLLQVASLPAFRASAAILAGALVTMATESWFFGGALWIWIALTSGLGAASVSGSKNRP